MSTLAEIEVAVAQLPFEQQEELYAHLGAQLDARPKRGLTQEEFDAWFEDGLWSTACRVLPLTKSWQ